MVVVELTFVGDEDIRALAQAHHQNRHFLVAEEDDRIAAAGDREFAGNGRNEMPILQEAEGLGDRLHAIGLVFRAVEWLHILVKRNRSGEARLGVWCVGHSVKPLHCFRR